ncbi:MAG: acyl carrier protein phosphodiesterase [Bacteroidetes bacterium]|nr:acyl carrier protein phosphodiesterase [Bacteroidota bacterium]
MNFLAHIALSGSDHEVAIGNFIADSILPKERALLSAQMQKGIALHHAIDTFTDQHSAFKNTVQLLRPTLKKYAPVAADVFYDHFLALHFQEYFNSTLKDYSATFYYNLAQHKNTLPGKGRELAAYIIQYDWLNMYPSIDGIHTILCQMSKRTRFESHLDKASLTLKEHYEEIGNDFKLLFPQLMQLSENLLKN